MAKRKQRAMMPMPGEPSPESQRRYAAEHVAETVLRTDSALKKKKNAIVDAVMAAANKALKGTKRGGQ